MGWRCCLYCRTIVVLCCADSSFHICQKRSDKQTDDKTWPWEFFIWKHSLRIPPVRGSGSLSPCYVRDCGNWSIVWGVCANKQLSRQKGRKVGPQRAARVGYSRGHVYARPCDCSTWLFLPSNSSLQTWRMALSMRAEGSCPSTLNLLAMLTLG